jgi:hypothetical protein
MSSNVRVSMSGSVTFWQTRQTPAATILRNIPATAPEEWAESLPRTRPASEALKAALSDLVCDNRTFVRPTKVGMGYEVVQQKPSLFGNKSEFESLATVLVGGSDTDAPWLVFPRNYYGAIPEERLRVRFEEARREITAGQIGGWLTQTIRKMGGVSLRESGGIFWVSRTEAHNLDILNKIIRDSGAGKVYTTETAIDNEAVEMVSDHILTEIRDTLQSISNDFQTKKPDARMRANRKELLERQQRRLADLTDIFGPLFTAAQDGLAQAVVAVMGCSESTDNVFEGIDFENFSPDMNGNMPTATVTTEIADAFGMNGIPGVAVTEDAPTPDDSAPVADADPFGDAGDIF